MSSSVLTSIYAQPHQTPRETTSSSVELRNPANLIFFPTSNGRPNVVCAGTYPGGEEPFSALNDRHRLVEDIPQANVSSNPRSFAVIGDTLYFFARSLGVEELWASFRLSPSFTDEMNTIFPGDESKGDFMIAFQDSLYFAAQNSTNNVELWMSDGNRTGAGTMLAGSELNSNANTGSFPEDLFGMLVTGTKPMVFFSADETSGAAPGAASQNRELWVRDLDRGLNYQVADINPGTLGGSDPKFFTSYSDRCFFIAFDGANYNLYRTDGLTAVPITLPGGAVIDDKVAPVASGGLLYFAASDGDGIELWAYDFVLDQANQVANINPGASNSSPHELTDVDGVLYFAADSTGIGVELFRSNGTAAGTYSIQDIGGIRSSNPSNITNVGGEVYFFSDDIGNGTGVLRFSDPATRSTVSFFAFDGDNGASPGTFGEILVLPSENFYFVADDQRTPFTRLWFVEKCPEVQAFYDTTTNNTFCRDGGSSGLPTVLRDGSQIVGSTVCPLGGCFSISNPSITIDDRTGEITLDPTTPTGNFTVTYNYDDGSCQATQVIDISIQETVSAELLVERVAGMSGVIGTTNASLLNSTFNFQQVQNFQDANNGLAFSPDGTLLYLADEKNNCVRALDLVNDTVFVVAGLCDSTAAGIGNTDAVGTAARFNQPSSVATDAFGNIYVADRGNHRIRVIDPNTRAVTTLAGSSEGDLDNINPLLAQFRFPSDIAIDQTGNLYIADRANHKIKKIATNGSVTSLTGIVNPNPLIPPIPGYVDSTTPSSVRFFFPSGLDIDAQGNLYVADMFNHRIRLVRPSGATETFAGTGNSGGSLVPQDADGNNTTAAQFFLPADLSFTASGSIFIADRGNNKVRVIDGNTTSTYAGIGATGFDDGPALNAEFNAPSGVAADFGGQVYVLDKNNHIIRRTIVNNPAGNITGSGTFCFYSTTSVPLELTNFTGTIVRWEVSRDDGMTFVDNGFAGNDEFILDVTGTTQADTVQVRAIVDIGSCGQQPSEVAFVILDAPDLATIVLNDPICLTSPTVSATIVAGGGFDGEFNWYDSEVGGTLLSNNDTLVQNISDTTDFFVSITRGGCETPRVRFTVLAIELPAPDINDSLNVCEDSPVPYSTVLDVNSEYTWTITGGGVIMPEDTNVVTAMGRNQIEVIWDTPGTGTVEVNQVTAGCAGTPDLINVNISPNPVPDISGDSLVCADLGLIYRTPNSGNSFQWSVTGGSIVGSNALDTVQVVWNTLGAGRLVLREENSGGCIIFDTLDVQINQSPDPSLTLVNGADSVCTDQIQSFTFTSPIGNQIVWEVTGGNILSGQSGDTLTVQWGAAGAGQVIVNVTDTSTVSDCSDSDTLNFTINAIPTASITSGGIVSCQRDTLTYLAANNGNPLQWTAIGGVINGPSDQLNVDVIWTNVGTQQIILEEIIAATGCNNFDTLDVTVNLSPTPLIVGDSSVCIGSTLIYTIPATSNQIQWTVNGGTILGRSDTTSLTVSWDVLGMGEVRVRELVGSSGCFTDDTLMVDVFSIPNPTLVGNDTVCALSTETYTIVDDGDFYNWSVTGGTILTGGTTAAVEVRWDAAGNGELLVEKIVISGSDTCRGSDTLQILINPLPAASISAGSNTVCEDLTSTYTAVDNGNPLLWRVIGGNIIGDSTQVNLDVEWTGTGTGQVILQETITATGCFDIDTLDVSLTPAPIPAINGLASVCFGDTVRYNVFDSGNQYAWSITNGRLINSPANDTIFVVWDGADPGLLVIRETNTTTSCFRDDSLTVTINPLPTPNVTGPVELCATEVATYRVTNSGNTYNWDVVNGVIVGGDIQDSVVINWTGPSPGLVIMREEVGGSGCFELDTLEVTINALPSPQIQGDAIVCEGDTAVYRINNSGNQFQWSASNGTIIGGNALDSVVVAWSLTSPRILRIEETNLTSSCFQSDSLEVNVTPRPSTDITGTFSLCASDTAFYQAAAAPGGLVYEYTWTVQGGTILSGANSQEVQVAWNDFVTGTEYIIVTIRVQGTGCEASTLIPSGPGDMGFVELNEIPAPSIVSPDNGLGQVCQGATHTYNTINDPGNTFIWSVSGGNITSGQGTNEITVEWPQAGTGSIDLTQSVDSSGCVNQATQVSLNILEAPMLPQAENRTLCAEGTANLFAIDEQVSTLRWYDVATGGTALDSTQSGQPFTTPFLTTIGSPYTYYVAGVNAAGCEGPRQAVVVDIDLAKTLSVNETFRENVETCNRDNSGRLFLEILDGNSPYTYDVLRDGSPFDSGTIPFGVDSLVLDSLQEGVYSVTITDDGNCIGNGSFNIITDLKFITGAMISPDTVIAENSDLSLIASADDAQTWSWTDSTGTVLSMDSVFNVTPEQSITYSVTITNDKGCDTTLSVFVNVIPLELFVPNTFTPNGDGRNDRFKVFGQGIKSINIQVFNRLDQMVHETSNWIEGDMFNDGIGWDGTFNGKLQAGDSYKWVVTGLYINDQLFKKTGTVLLVR